MLLELDLRMLLYFFQKIIGYVKIMFELGQIKKNFLFSVHPSEFFQVGRAGFFFVFLFCNEAYLVFIIQWGTSLHLHLSDYETAIPLFTMKPTTTRKKNV